MRLFIGVDLPKEVKDYLYLTQKGIGSSYAKIKWVEKKNLHLTIKFLGEAKEDDVKSAKEKLKNIKLRKFKARLNSLGFYPNEVKINVLWVGTNNEEKIKELQMLVDSETMNLGDIKLGSHITLGRVKFIKNKHEFKEKIKNIKVQDLEFNINEFCLFESKLTKDGPIYRILEVYSLE